MNKLINRRQAICGTVWFFIICAALILWPLRLVKETIRAEGGQAPSGYADVTADNEVMQMFLAQYDRIDSVRIYLSELPEGGTFNFTLYDGSMKVLMQQDIDVTDMDEPGYCRVQLRQDVTVNNVYYYRLQATGGTFAVAYEDRATSANFYNGTFYYGNIEDDDHTVVAAYDYVVPLRKGKTALLWAGLLIIGLLVTVLTGQYYKKRPFRNTLFTAEKAFRAVAVPLTILAAVAAMLLVWPGKLFSHYAVSNVFYEAGIVLLALLCLYGICHKRANKRYDLCTTALREHGRDWLQALCLGAALQGCCDYVNGLYEIHHSLAYRSILIWLCLAVICTYKKKELLNWYNILYLILWIIGAPLYYHGHAIGLATAEEIRLLRLTVFAALPVGLVLLNTVRILILRQLKKPAIVYGLLLAVLLALLIVFRNTRGWPIFLACVFVVFYLRMAAWKGSRRLLSNISLGITFQFLYMMGYCLLHRPYLYSIYSRYPLFSHTVTIAAVYLSLVVCAALVRLLDAFRRSRRLADLWKELTVFGFALVYLVLTMSRTAYISVFAVGAVITIIVCFCMEKKWRAFGKAVAYICLALVFCFPIVFTAQRTLPSVAAAPIYSEYEEWPAEIVHGRVPDSRYYMTITRFAQLFETKILGMSEQHAVEAHMEERADAQTLPAMVQEESGLIASAAEISAGEISTDTSSLQQVKDDVDEFANGRIEIFRSYLQNLNATGHDVMGAELPDGTTAVHAHNNYIQVAYDNGIFVAVVFALFVLGSLVQGLRYFFRHREDRACSILPFALTLLFAAVGLTEWTFHPCNEMTLFMFLALAPLLWDMRKDISE